MELLKNAELFAKNKHAGMMKKDGMTSHSKHLEGVVNRLKSLGVIDVELLCTGWLHDTEFCKTFSNIHNLITIS